MSYYRDQMLQSMGLYWRYRLSQFLIIYMPLQRRSKSIRTLFYTTLFCSYFLVPEVPRSIFYNDVEDQFKGHVISNMNSLEDLETTKNREAMAKDVDATDPKWQQKQSGQ